MLWWNRAPILISIPLVKVRPNIVPPPAEIKDIYDMFLWLYTGLCHQLPSRSFFWYGHKFPVCARDTGTYLGFTLGLLLGYLWLRNSKLRKWFTSNLGLAWIFAGLAMLPFAFDGITSYMGLRQTTNPIRFATGLIAGSHIGTLLILMYMMIENRLEVFDIRMFSVPINYLPFELGLLLGDSILWVMQFSQLTLGFLYWSLVLSIPTVLLIYNLLIVKVAVMLYPKLNKLYFTITISALMVLIELLGSMRFKLMVLYLHNLK